MDRNARLFVAQLAASSSGEFFGVVRLHLCSTIKVVHEYSISTGTKVYTSAHSFCITIKRANLGRFFIVVLQQMRRFRVWQTSHSFICILVVYLVVQSAAQSLALIVVQPFVLCMRRFGIVCPTRDMAFLPNSLEIFLDVQSSFGVQTGRSSR